MWRKKSRFTAAAYWKLSLVAVAEDVTRRNNGLWGKVDSADMANSVLHLFLLDFAFFTIGYMPVNTAAAF